MSDRYTANHLEAIGHMFFGGFVQSDEGFIYKMKDGEVCFFLKSAQAWRKSNSFYDEDCSEHGYYLIPLGEDLTKPKLEFMQVLQAMWDGETGVWKMINKPFYTVSCDKRGDVDGFGDFLPMFGKEMKSSGLWVKVEEGNKDE